MAGLTTTDKTLTFSYLKYLNGLCASGKLSEDSSEGLTVAMDLLQTTFELDLNDQAQADQYKLKEPLEETVRKLVTEKETVESAESYKTRGNQKLDQGDYNGAIELYTKAIELDKTNATFFANRAAAYMYLQDYIKAKKDCKVAVEMNPQYSRAYHRLGRICAHLNEKEDARTYYSKAIEIDPSNEKYKADLQALDEDPSKDALDPDADASDEQQPRSAPGGPFGGLNIGELLSNPNIMNMAASMMQNPAVQSTLSNLASGMASGQQAAGTGAGGGGTDAFANLLPQMQQVAGQMKQSNPELFDQLRGQIQKTQQPSKDPPSNQDPPTTKPS